MRLLKATIAEFTKDDAFSLSAALAYYTLLSLAPLLVLLVGIATGVILSILLSN